jgi:hypothetical protein
MNGQVQVVAELMNDLHRVYNSVQTPLELREAIGLKRAARLFGLGFAARDQFGIVRTTPAGRLFHQLVSNSSIAMPVQQ